MTFQQKFTSRLLLCISLLVFLTPEMVTVVTASPAAQDGPVYIVQQGDTLNSISLRFGISPEEVAAANNITDPNALMIGQRLVIPGLEGINGVLTSAILPFGSSLTGLVRQYQLQQEDLVFLNRIASPSETIAGLKFIIPINEGVDPLTPLASPGPASTLIEMAIRSGCSPWHLVEDNNLEGTWEIQPGETLFISGLGEEAESPQFPFPIQDIALNNLPVIQGETLHIAISSRESAEFKGSFDNRPLYFFTEDNENYFAFHGIHALTEPGPVPLEIKVNLKDGGTVSFEQLVMLAEGGYGNEWVNVPEEYLDEAVIAEEDAYLKPILDLVTPQKHWDDKFQYPVDEPCVNSGFGQRRDYNNGGLFFYHTGMDFAVCAQNLNIYAPAAGEVVLAEELVIKGKAILIDHGWGVFSGYWHLAEFNVEVGDFVEAGDLLGQIGNTGRSAGPHLHFEIDITGTPVNPATWLEQEFPQPAS
jgi:murein DD-endopeptidase MepM/ murein hydrolase activator NlpD